MPSPFSNNQLTTLGEVRIAIWSALKWVIFTGLALAFSAGSYAAALRADVNKSLEGATAAARTEKQVDSLRIEMRHISTTQDEVLTYLKHRR